MANRDFFLAKKEIHGFYGIVAVGHNVLKKQTQSILKALNLLHPELASFSISSGNFSNYDCYKLKTFFVHFCPGFTSTPHDYTPSLEMHLPSLKNAFSQSQNAFSWSKYLFSWSKYAFSWLKIKKKKKNCFLPLFYLFLDQENAFLD